MRDDFGVGVKDLLAKRAGGKCSNPDCRLPTSGPQLDPQKSVNVGVAAHITAAATGGPRYAADLCPEERASSDNGIWLCQKCAKLIDNDTQRYSVEVLRRWRRAAELQASAEVAGMTVAPAASPFAQRFAQAEGLMPELFQEMRADLEGHPLRRGFVPMSRRWTYWASGTEFLYYTEEHQDLMNKVLLLENMGFVRDVTRTNAKRYRMTEEFVTALQSG